MPSPKSSHTTLATARTDSPGWFHVVQRGLGRRPVFACAPDIRCLLELLGREAVEGRVEVHAFVVLTNHCHLLVRGRAADLSASMRRLFAAYSRRINRRLRRDGPLFGSRSRTRPIRSAGHWCATLAYIDRNPVEAGLVRAPHLYPFGSAWHYARPAGPSWLTRDAVEEHVRLRTGRRSYDPDDYERVLGVEAVPEGARGVVARRLERRDEADPLDDLLAAAPRDVQRWLERMAQRADGGAAGPALVDPVTLLGVLDERRRAEGSWRLSSLATAAASSPWPSLRPVRRGGLKREGWTVLASGLLRTACGLTLEEIGGRIGMSVGGVHYQVGCHERHVVRDALYRRRAEQVLRAVLLRDYPDAARR